MIAQGRIILAGCMQHLNRKLAGFGRPVAGVRLARRPIDRPRSERHSQALVFQDASVPKFPEREKGVPADAKPIDRSRADDLDADCWLYT